MTRVLKLFLCLILLFCTAVIGVHLSGRLSRRRDVLIGFDTLFHRALIQIEYNAGDLCEVFSDNFADFIFQHSIPFDVQWKRFVHRFSYILKKEDMELLSAFSDDLGAANCDAQKQHIELYRQLLQEHIQNAEEDIRTKSKTVRIIPLSVGIVLSLLMI